MAPPLLVVGPLTISGPGSSQLTLDGSVAAAGGRRILVAATNVSTTNFQFSLSGVRLLRGRVDDGIGGCIGATKDTTLNDVVFESCEAVSGPTSGAYGGALFVGNDASNAANVRPNVTIANSRFIGNRAIHGASDIRSEGGAIALGGTPAPGTDDYWVGAVSISNTVLSGNSADTRGAVLIAGAADVTISHRRAREPARRQRRSRRREDDGASRRKPRDQCRGNAGGAVLGGLTTDARGTGLPRVIGSFVDMGAFEADPATTTGCTLDVDGNGTRDALTDGLLIVRALIGMTGTAATSGALGAVPLRADWTSIRNYLNANCGTSLAP